MSNATANKPAACGLSELHLLKGWQFDVWYGLCEGWCFRQVHELVRLADLVDSTALLFHRTPVTQCPRSVVWQQLLRRLQQARTAEPLTTSMFSRQRQLLLMGLTLPPKYDRP
jgi:hypothetical protein